MRERAKRERVSERDGRGTDMRRGRGREMRFLFPFLLLLIGMGGREMKSWRPTLDFL